MTIEYLAVITTRYKHWRLGTRKINTPCSFVMLLILHHTLSKKENFEAPLIFIKRRQTKRATKDRYLTSGDIPDSHNALIVTACYLIFWEFVPAQATKFGAGCHLRNRTGYICWFINNLKGNHTQSVSWYSLKKVWPVTISKGERAKWYNHKVQETP